MIHVCVVTNTKKRWTKSIWKTDDMRDAMRHLRYGRMTSDYRRGLRDYFIDIRLD
jgi:hypothetical protein